MIKGVVQFIWISLLSVLCMFAVIASIKTEFIEPLINSDSLFFHIFFTDLIIEGNTLKGWDLNTTFNQFPNALLYLAAFLLSQNPFINTMLHGLLQYSLFFVALFLFYRSFKPQIPLYWHIPGIVLLHLFFVDALLVNDYMVFSFFVLSYHYGALINFFLLLAATQYYLRKPSQRKAWIIVLLAALGVSSSILLLIMFMLPWLTAMFMAYYRKNISLKVFLNINGITFGGAALGILIFIVAKNLRIFTFYPTHLFSVHNIIPSLKVMVDSYTELFTRSIPMMITGLLFLAFFIFTVIWCIRMLFSKRPGNPSLFDLDNLMMVNLGFIVLLAVVPVINGMMFEAYEIRYNFFVLIIPFINSGVIAWHYFHKSKDAIIRRVSLISLIVFSAAVALLILVTPVKERLDAKRQYYPDVARVMDEFMDEYPLQNGIGDYWDAKLASVFSRNDVRLRQVYHGMDMYALASPRSWYRSQRPGDPVPVFNYVLYRETVADMETIHEIFGNDITFVEREGFLLIIVPPFTYQGTQGNRLRLMEKDDFDD
jgi:hypothetical protein